MSEWKTLKEILPEIGRLMIDDPERGYERLERQWTNSLPITCWADVFSQGGEYRIKPSTVTRTVTYPEPLRKEPKYGETYWSIATGLPYALDYSWNDLAVDKTRLKHGICFATKADAQAAQDALFGGE